MNKKLTSSRSVGMRDIKSLLCSAHMGHFLSHWPKEHNGFTLLELLVVILIIGILAAIALPQYQLAVVKSRYAALKPMVEAIWQAQQVYYLTNGTYATSLDALDVGIYHKGNHQYFADVYCTLGTGGSVYCKNLISEISYVKAYSNSVRHCVSYLKPLSVKVCKQETNNTPASNEYLAKNGWYEYPN